MLKWTRSSFAAIVILSAVAAFGQAINSGDIRGTVTDTTGAVIPGVKVDVVNVNTGVAKVFVTDGAGLYDTSSIVDGTYRITFTKDGFKQFVRGPISVLVGYTSVNAQLQVGAMSQRVVVTTNVPLLKTETGAQETTLTSQAMEQLPQVGQDWEPFTILLPGAASNSTSSSLKTNPGQDASIDGNLPYPAILADGASSTLPQSIDADVDILESVAELQVSASNFSAQYGTGGTIYNQISKGGTDHYHGVLYEYFQNSALNAEGYGFGNNIPVPFLRYNNYGGSVGGPILKKRMFFFFDYDKIDNEGNSSGYSTLPTAAMLSGDFSGQPTIYDPTTQVITQTPGGPVVTRQSFAQEYGQGNRIPANLVDPVAKAIAAYFPTPANHPSTGLFVPGTESGGVAVDNYYSSVADQSPETRFFGRLDYDISPSNRLTMTDAEKDNPGAAPGVFQCPISCQLSDEGGNVAEISDVWTISPDTINELRLGFTNNYSMYSDPSENQNYPSQLGLQFAKANEFPDVSISGVNCCSAPSGTTNANYTQYTYDPSDVVTRIRGRNVLHFGGEFLDQQRDGNEWGAIQGASVGYSGYYTESTVGDGSTGSAFADFLLGQTYSWSANVSPDYGGRIKQPQAFIQDDMKVRPNLTLNMGLRWQGSTGISESHNDISDFDPTVMNPATGTDGAIWYAETAANGRRKLIAPSWSNFLPRFGASWQPVSNLVVRGGIGLYVYPYDFDQNGFGLGDALQRSGSLTDETNGLYPVVILSSSGSQLPFGTSDFAPAALGGQSVSYVAYQTPLAKSLQWSLTVQRELGTNMVANISYVGNKGYDLYAPYDVNQVPQGDLSPNDQSDAPYPYYGSIYGSTNNGYSNYNALQASIDRRMTGGLDFNFNYTWSKFLDTQDSGGNGNAIEDYQIANPAANYGPSEFDTRNSFKGRVVYLVPVGVGRTFLGNHRLVDFAIGGWQIAGTIVAMSGNPFTPVITSPNNSYSLGGYWYPNVIGNPRPANRSIQEWFNPGAYTAPADGTFGDMQRNSVYGPGMSELNLSAGKSFDIREGKAQLLIRGDATNAPNHTSFGLPNYGLTCTTPGVPCTGATNIPNLAVPGRQMQLGARLSF